MRSRLGHGRKTHIHHHAVAFLEWQELCAVPLKEGDCGEERPCPRQGNRGFHSILVSDETACALVHWLTPQFGDQAPRFERRGGDSRLSNPATLLRNQGVGVMRRFLRLWVPLVLSLPL